MAVDGCAPSEVGPKPEPPQTTQIADDSMTLAAELLGEQTQRIVSIVDKYSITLPPGFRGTVLTDREIERFALAFGKAQPEMASQVRAQCQRMRAGGGALFAVNVLPDAVSDGFSDNMNVRVEGSIDKPNLEYARSQAAQSLRSGQADVQIQSTELTYKGGKMVELRATRLEGSPERQLKIAHFLYITMRSNQVFRLSYATSEDRAQKVSRQFRASALSLEFR